MLNPEPYTRGSGRVPLRVVGVPIRAQAGSSKPVANQDYPTGIEGLNTDWFLDRLSVESLAACSTDDDLRRIRARAEMVLELISLRNTARGGG